MATNVVHEEKKKYEATETPPDQDGLWKNLITELFEKFMQFFAPRLYEEIDFTKDPDFLQQELYKEIIQGKKGRVAADQIVKVFLKNGDERWILIHIEVEGKDGADFPKRMFRYFYRIYDKFDREIYAIALLTDAEKSTYHNQYRYSFHGTELEYTYNIYKFDSKNIKKLEQSSNPFAAAVIAGIYASKTKNDSQQRYIFKRKLMTQILQKFTMSNEETHTYFTALLYFIDYLLQVPEELKQKFIEEIRPLIGKEEVLQMKAEKEKLSPTLAAIFAEAKEEGEAKGIEKGRAEGKAEGKAEGIEEAKIMFAQELIRNKYSDETIAKLTKLDVEVIKKLRKEFE
ncbi:hypothetical protein CIL05_00205 [Virgibacillus profundi]|uniref:Transposase (putative) YhgA-like domain-containing protein n=1 Tax=Virgibacillus profundi TaxID=2024555 RepID=A0A2A2IHL3_9BACI|nr:hypothetical protein [Virgibacillus profundi]PAV31117.1 hypothetical protein CIL05_00205 [Virgibacillus profundi]PXY55300.1 hypothetical protein CIT14_00205 [Virgibacillus profundi]